MKLYTETATPELLSIAKSLSGIPEFSSFRLVGGTALALQLGHRKSVDIDFFSNEKISKKSIENILRDSFQVGTIEKTEHNILTYIDGVRVEMYDDWSTPFLDQPITEAGIRMASLADLANFKIEAIIERREKKDYIDLYYLFKEFDPQEILKQHKKSNPLVSDRSILFALKEVKTAAVNESPMPNLTRSLEWNEITDTITKSAKKYFKKNIGMSLFLSVGFLFFI